MALGRADSPGEPRGTTLHFIVGVAWLVYWMTNSYIWIKDVVPFLDYYVITTLYVLYFIVSRPVQILALISKPIFWAWTLTALIPLIMYFLGGSQGSWAYAAMRTRITMFSIFAGSALLLFDREGPRMLRTAAGISLFVGVAVNIADVFIYIPYNRSPTGRSAGFYADANISAAAIGTLLILTIDVTKQSLKGFTIVAISLLAILTTLSRSGMLFATVLAASYLFIPRGPGTLSLAARLAVAVIGSLLLAIVIVASINYFDVDLSEAWRLRSAFALDLTDQSAQGRLDRLSFGLQKFSENIWTGRGLGSATFYGLSAHNTYITIGHDYGILGLLAYLAAVSQGMFALFVYGWSRATTAAFLCFQIAYYSMFAHDVDANACVFVVFAALAVKATIRPASEAAPTRADAADHRLGLVDAHPSHP